jgi:hypothetical protein
MLGAFAFEAKVLKNSNPRSDQLGPRELGALEQRVGLLKGNRPGVCSGFLVSGMSKINFDSYLMNIP